MSLFFSQLLKITGITAFVVLVLVSIVASLALPVSAVFFFLTNLG